MALRLCRNKKLGQTEVSSSFERKTHESKYILHLHIAALLFGGTALFSKILPYNAVDIIAFRTLVCGIIVGFIALLFKQGLIIKNLKRLTLLVLCSLLFTAHWTAYFQAMQLSSVAIGIISMFTFPVMTVFLEPLIKDTKLHAIDIVMAVLVILGVLLMVPSLSLNNDITAGIAFGLLSALAVSIRNILVSKHLSQHISAFTIMTYHSLISAAVLLPFVSINVGDITGENWLLIILLGSVFTAIPHTQKTFALKYASAKTVSMIVSLQVVYASIFAFLLLNEKLELTTIIAAFYESVWAKHEATRY
jgi:drug/metabolite transporter (DMT)-like permease